MLPQEFEPIEAEEVRASEQGVQPCFEHRLWSEYCCTTLIENLYMNVIEIVYYVPRRIMRVIKRRATMLAGDRSRGAISPASILSESRNFPNFVHWHIC